jgi:hypothetical protein
MGFEKIHHSGENFSSIGWDVGLVKQILNVAKYWRKNPTNNPNCQTYCQTFETLAAALLETFATPMEQFWVGGLGIRFRFWGR